MQLSGQPEFAPAWQELKDNLRTSVGDSIYSVWFTGLSVASWDGEVLSLSSTPGTERFIAERFGRTLERCCHESFGPRVVLAYAGEPALTAHQALQAAGAEHVDPLLRDQPFVPRFTFDQFIIGPGNRLAHGAALAVAESPGGTYNPLFLHAPPGLGKTHLLHAIGNYITSFDPSKTVRYTTVEAFTNGFIAALHGRDLDRFKAIYRGVDVLLIDDVQFLESKAKTEEEFFHTFNALYGSGRQLVLTCDRLPSQLTNLEQRLRERLDSGLVATIDAPDFKTRLAILSKRVQLDSVPVSDPTVLELIADRVTDNVRQLEGALIRVIANHSLTGRPLDADLAAAILDENYPRTAAGGSDQSLAAEEIIKVVAQHFAITADEMTSASRKSNIAWARQLAIHFCRELTDLPLVEIGQCFGGRNHATVLHACGRVQERMKINNDDRQDVQTLNKLLVNR